MRGQTLRTLSGRRNRKRCLLAGLILVSGPSLLAQEPVALAPLPLRPVAESRAAGAGNPFCEPVVASLSDSGFTRLADDAAAERPRRPTSQIELASGIEIRIEEAGLDRPTAETAAPQRDTFPPPVTIVGRGGVRANPIAIDVETASPRRPGSVSADPALPSPDLPKPVALSLSDAGMIAVTIDSPPAISLEAPTELSLSDLEPTPSATELSLSDVVSQSLADDTAEPTVARPAMAGRLIPVPHEDSLSEDPETGGGTIRSAVKLQPFDLPAADVKDARLVNGGHPRVDVGRPPLIVQRVPRILPAELVPQRMESQESPLTESADAEAATTEPVVQRAAVAGGASGESQPRSVDAVVRSTPRSAQPAQPPLPTLAAQTIQPSPSAEPAQPVAGGQREAAEPAVARAAAEAKGLRLKPREVRALKLGESIHAVHSGDPRVATAIALGTDGLQVVATGDGATTLTIDLVDVAGQTRRVGYRVEVGEVRSATADSQPTLVETLTETVRNAFPEARVLVRSEAGRLTVVGSCPDDSTARQVMRMVRSACRVAVDDKLIIR